MYIFFLKGWKPPLPVLLCELFEDPHPVAGTPWPDERWLGVLRAFYYYPPSLSYIVKAAIVKQRER